MQMLVPAENARLPPLPRKEGHRSYLSHITYTNLIMKNKILKIMLLRIAPPPLGGGPLLSLLHISHMNEKGKACTEKHVLAPRLPALGGPSSLAAPATIKYVRTTYISASISIGKSTYLTIL